MQIILCGGAAGYEAEHTARLFFPAADRADTVPETGDFVAVCSHEKTDFVLLHLDGKSYWRTALRDADADAEYALCRLLYTLLCDVTKRTLPWGMMTGVRPVRIIHDLRAAGWQEDAIRDRFLQHFSCTPEKFRLALSIADLQRPVLDAADPKDCSVYAGIPICPTRCSYCSFVSRTVGDKATRALVQPYVDKLCEELTAIRRTADRCGLRIRTFYIGGGTPTTLDEHQLARLLSALENHFDFSHLCEYTVEAGRPDTITPEKLRVLKSAGVGRVSINPQSMNDAVLAAIGRKHGSADVLRAFDEARQAGFDEINMDLIAGLTGDTAETFAQTVDTLLNLSPENITVHTLAIKRGADLTDKAAAAAQRETVSQMLDGASHALQNAGYGPYYLYRQKFMAGGFENVGWCKPDTECFYNVSMMEELQTILSLGAGGVSKRVVRETGWIERANNPKYPLEYIQAADRLANGKKKLLFPKK